jgi:hypothetical protein
MADRSWVGSVWSLRGVAGPVIGHVEAEEGPTVTMTVFGLGGHAPDGLEILPSSNGFVRCARISMETLLASWSRMGGGRGDDLLRA